jgi:fermentation-respiration switch protein FrsA (DUF1100 family)
MIPALRHGVHLTSHRATTIRLAATALCAVTLAVSTAACGHSAGDAPDAGEARPDPRPTWAFYTPPAPLPARPPGTLIRSEPVSAPPHVHGWRILYHSRSLTGRDIAVSGSVLVPDTAPPATGRNVIAWAHGTTGSGDRCAPSTDAHPANGIEDARPLLAAGDAIVATDYQGLGTPGPHPYLIGASEARSVLDAVRAARHLPRTGLGAGLVVFGHSQGGQAALFTAELAAGYAPDLRLLGAAAAAPPTDLTALAARVTGLDYGVAYLVEMAAGYSATDPAARLSTIMTTRAAARLHLVEDACTDDLISAYDHLSASAVFTHDPRTTPPWSTGLAANSVSTVPRSVPVLIMQGTRDPIVSADVTARAVTAMCRAGDSVSYRTYPKAAHNVVPTAADDLDSWIAARFRGRPAPRTCPAPTAASPPTAG